MRPLRAILTALMALVLAESWSQDLWPLQAFEDRRFKENWFLCEPSTRDSLSRNFSDRLKNLYLNKEKSLWLSSGGQVRVRYMGTVNEEFQDRNTGLFTLRGRLHAGLNYKNVFRIFAEGIYSNTTNDNSIRIGMGSPVSQGAFLNLFGEMNLPVNDQYIVGFWGGRREMQHGHERLVSPGNWLNTRRSWDGFGAFYGNNKRRISAFWSKPVFVIPDGFSRRDVETVFWGVRYQTDELNYESNTGVRVKSWSSYDELYFEPYLYGLHRKNVVFEQGTEDEERYTLGALLSGPLNFGNFNFELEAAYQFGSFGDANLGAYFASIEFGYAPDLAWNPHFWAGFDYASGDSDPDDNKLGTFDPMFPQAAQWFGEHGLIERKNLVSYSINADFSPAKKITSRFTFWKFHRANRADAIYNTANGILRPAIPDGSKDLGYSFQLSNVYRPTYQWEFTLTYNFWDPGRFIAQSQTSPAKIQHFFMITSQFTF